MGYTNFFYAKGDMNPAIFAQAAKECEAVCKASTVALEDAEFSDNLIRFDGGCETFHFSRERAGEGAVYDGFIFGFCKTRMLPYDFCVKACLLILKSHFPEMRISSDGEVDSEWVDAVEIVKQMGVSLPDDWRAMLSHD